MNIVAELAIRATVSAIAAVTAMAVYEKFVRPRLN